MTYKIVDVKQGTPEWLKWRQSVIGASDVAGIMGVSPFKGKTPYGIWLEKTQGSKAESTAAQRRGTALEQAARDAYIKIIGVDVDTPCLQHLEKSWMGASFDGLNIEKGIAVEIKCPSAKDHLVAVNGNVPDYYFPQMQHQMYVAGLSKMHYASFDGNNIVIVEVIRDDAYIKEMIAVEEEFWKLVCNLTPPDLSEGDYEEVVTQEWSDLVEEWKAQDDLEKAAAKSKASLKTEMLAIAGDRPIRGFGVKVQFRETQGSLDYSKLEEVIGDLAPFRKPPTKSVAILREKRC